MPGKCAVVLRFKSIYHSVDNACARPFCTLGCTHDFAIMQFMTTHSYSWITCTTKYTCTKLSFTNTILMKHNHTLSEHGVTNCRISQEMELMDQDAR